MYYLALETTSLRGSLALFEDSRCVREVLLPEGLVHGRETLAEILGLVQENRMLPRALGGVVVSLGPGSYTGIRVGVTAAKTLSFALRIPIAGVSAHEVLAAGAALEMELDSGNPGPQLLAPLLDGRQGFFYGALFEHRSRTADPRPAESLERRVADQVGTAARVESWLSPGCRIFGGGADLFLEVLQDSPLRRSLVRGPRAWDLPRARVLGLLGWPALSAARFDLEETHNLVPLYLRPSEPEIRLARGKGR
jgi:tRNA threonylcarbamoyladenosine biosynthesis protein TsaB